MKVINLKDCPQGIETVARWHQEQWQALSVAIVVESCSGKLLIEEAVDFARSKKLLSLYFRPSALLSTQPYEIIFSDSLIRLSDCVATLVT
ncbi:hypothetical protein [uncultured Endozoicomonas sp.]|uniref:hypothetical protein n=1 Tax=uncultured Endozoicomonas sp. TaxID=432652 RepID=UPI002621227E|nr:hypothetical protein [uncultured Endozoicomonas sp.]